MESRKQQEKKKQLIKDIIKRKVITEQEINLIKRRLNNGTYIYEDIQDLTGLKLTPEQTEKGFNWLMDKWKTPTGKEKENNPFGYKEEQALKTFKEFELNSFIDMDNNNFIPIYDVIGKNSSFQYIVTYKGVTITG